MNYRVVRNASFPYWYDYGWWRKPYPNVPEMEITNGTTITDGEGKFKIDFIAIPRRFINSSIRHKKNCQHYKNAHCNRPFHNIFFERIEQRTVQKR